MNTESNLRAKKKNIEIIFFLLISPNIPYTFDAFNMSSFGIDIVHRHHCSLKKSRLISVSNLFFCFVFNSHRFEQNK